MTKDWKRLMRMHLEKDDQIEERLQQATAPRERRKIRSEKRFNDYMLRALSMLALGLLGAPEDKEASR